MAGGEADGKTEDPTSKRLGEARSEGNIPRSQDLVAWISILAGFSMVERTFKKGTDFVHNEMNKMSALISAPDQQTALKFMVHSIGDSFILIAPLVITFMIIGIVGHLAQVRFNFAKKAMKPQISRLNPIAGVKRLFSTQSVFNLAKESVKATAFGLVAYWTLWDTVTNLSRNGPYSMDALIGIVVAAVVKFIKLSAAVGVLIGIVDYMWSRRKIRKGLKMTKQEVKDEAKQGDMPAEIKGKMRQKQAQMSRNRMMAAVASADVVIVNPVHIAMALKYDAALGAPRVVAKGAGFVAEKIREKADEGRVPIVQDIPLARALHKSCDINDEVPWQLFEAVAMVLAFVYGLRNRGTQAGYHRMPGTPELEEVERNEDAFDLLAVTPAS